jgi:putative transcriptional regulator
MKTKDTISPEGAELLQAIRQMKAGETGRVYAPEQILAIAARRSSKLTQVEFAQLLDVSVDAIRDWEQGRRSPRGAARTLLRVAMQHPEVLQQLEH